MLSPTPARGRGLIAQLLALLVVPLVLILLVIAFGGLTLHGRGMRELVGERDARAARSSATALGEQLAHHAALIQSLATSAHGNDPLDDTLRRFSFLQADFEGGVGFFTRDGVLLASAGPDPRAFAQPPVAAALQALLREATPQPAFSPAVRTESHGDYMMLAVAATADDTVVAGLFSLTGLAHHALASALGPAQQVSVFVVDEDRQVLYRSGALPPAVDFGSHPGITGALRGDTGTLYLQAPDGEHVVAYSPVSPGGWALVIEERWEDVDNPLLRTTQAAPLALSLPLALAAIALWFGARQVVQPLQVLERRAADLAWGRFTTIEQPVGGIAEIRRLQATLAHMARKVQAAQTGLRDYIGAITLGQEEERRRLARELHDDTLQALIALNQRLYLAGLALEGHPAASSLAEIQQLLDQTVVNLRRLMRALRPIYLEDLGLAAALEALARETQQNGGPAVDFHVTGTARRLAPQTEMALYRMAQEAISNVLRHAYATQAAIALDFEAESLSLTITDNGRGFRVPESPAEFAPQGHFGLLGLHERVELVGGRLEIESAPGQGTRVRVVLPPAPRDERR